MFFKVNLSLGEGVSEILLGVVVVVVDNLNLTSRELTQLSYFIQEIRVVLLNGVKKCLLGRMSCDIFERSGEFRESTFPIFQPLNGPLLVCLMERAKMVANRDHHIRRPSELMPFRMLEIRGEPYVRALPHASTITPIPGDSSEALSTSFEIPKECCIHLGKS